MTKTRILQGREVSDTDIELIRSLLSANPTWGRSRLSVELCLLWDWRNAQGRIKDMAARTLLLKLERADAITLPPRQKPSQNTSRKHRIQVPVKDVYLYPLSADFRAKLSVSPLTGSLSVSAQKAEEQAEGNGI